MRAEISPKRSREKNSEENLEKDSPHVLFVFAWYEGLHCIRPEIVVQLVNMEKGFVWFPTIACLSKTCPTDSEFHSVRHRSTYSVRTAGHFARFTPDSDFFHHTFCTVHSVCSHLIISSLCVLQSHITSSAQCGTHPNDQVNH